MFYFVIKEFSINYANNQWFLRSNKECLFFVLTLIKQWVEFFIVGFMFDILDCYVFKVVVKCVSSVFLDLC